ncbi:alpha/beta fold hydrolase [Acidisoma sp. L85]|uniref:alpha/beta fold hydrolase n=1 Tax=Acidisoma sp. L85 TaxID=1641850 RepID=UPI00131C4AB1|nr:alpha/beta fold hydrolase [Acidisoma sp. L85]
MRAPILLAVATAATLVTAQVARAAPVASASATTTYHRVQVGGLGIFYCEAGPKDAPTIVLLHGFPSSSREFDILIPLLATHYHLIAPDFPGFGQSDAPTPSSYNYTFDQLAKTINDLLEILQINNYTFYLHDYGAPVGFRIILMHPERLHALIIQNGNAYKDGLGAKWARIAEYWANPKAYPEVSANLFVDLNLDSFKLIILHMALEQECGVELEPDDSVATVAQMIDAMLVAMNQATKRATTLKIVPKASDV